MWNYNHKLFVNEIVITNSRKVVWENLDFCLKLNKYLPSSEFSILFQKTKIFQSDFLERLFQIDTLMSFLWTFWLISVEVSLLEFLIKNQFN